jgi:hypothetical protein
VPLYRSDEAWQPDGIALDERYRLPVPGQLSGQAEFADLRMAWQPAGLIIDLRVAGKRQPPWCRAPSATQSDGLQLWVDTRDTHDVHRASRFCHWFVMLPAMGSHAPQPYASALKINRAKSHPRPTTPDQIRVASQIDPTGYTLRAFVAGAALTGWDTAEQNQLGFFYTVMDRELGVQTFGPGLELPITEDPSLWQTLVMTDEPMATRKIAH